MLVRKYYNMSPSTLIWNSPLPAEWPVRADSLKVKNYTKNTQQIIFFISRKINTNILGPNFFEPKLSPAQKNLNQVYPAACASSELLQACFLLISGMRELQWVPYVAWRGQPGLNMHLQARNSSCFLDHHHCLES